MKKKFSRKISSKRMIISAVLVVALLFIYVLIMHKSLSEYEPDVEAEDESYKNYTFPQATYQQVTYKGVYNNADYSKPADEWVAAAKKFGGENAVVDLVVGQANVKGQCWLFFPVSESKVSDSKYIISSSQTDLPGLYLQAADEADVKVILNLQPQKANVSELIDIVLDRYSHHASVVGINIDMEWKKTGRAYYVSNEERDEWLRRVKSYDESYKLFLTYFLDYTYFPDDTDDLIVVYDGQGGSQKNILRQYKELASHFRAAGISTGYSSSTPPAATDEEILEVAPNTVYIVHTDDVF